MRRLNIKVLNAIRAEPEQDAPTIEVLLSMDGADFILPLKVSTGHLSYLNYFLSGQHSCKMTNGVRQALTAITRTIIAGVSAEACRASAKPAGIRFEEMGPADTQGDAHEDGC